MEDRIKRLDELTKNYTKAELLKAWLFKELDEFYNGLDKEQAKQFLEELHNATEEDFLEVFKEAIIETGEQLKNS